MISVISFVNKNTSGYINFKNSFSKFNGWQIKIIGWKTKWEGWITRMMAYRDYCKTCPPDQILVLLDGYDILCLQDSKNFIEKYKKIDKKYVFGCENMCAEYINCRKPMIWQNYYKIFNKYINGGCIIGKASDLYYLYKWCIDLKHTADDQIALSHFMDHHYKDVYLDIDSIFVYNDSLAKTATIQNINNTITVDNKNPYFIHFPGLMIMNSLPLQSSTGDIPFNYKFVLSIILGDSAIYEYALNKNIYLLSSILIYILITIIIVTCIVFIIIFYIKYKSCKSKK
jgi:hypothetical protein